MGRRREGAGAKLVVGAGAEGGRGNHGGEDPLARFAFAFVVGRDQPVAVRRGGREFFDVGFDRHRDGAFFKFAGRDRGFQGVGEAFGFEGGLIDVLELIGRFQPAGVDLSLQGRRGFAYLGDQDARGGRGFCGLGGGGGKGED
jgi:hypothetical protein